jgi:hypothetical protein
MVWDATGTMTLLADNFCFRLPRSLPRPVANTFLE